MYCFARMSLKCSLPQSRKLRSLVRTICYFVFVVILSPCLFAQTGTATLSGTITDKTGALLPAVRVTIANEDTGVSIEKRTNGAGIYNAPGLNPGHYHLFVAKEGFMQVDVRDVTLNVQDAVNRNFTLELGGTSETVQVNGGGVNINTSNAEVGTVIDRQFVENIPMNGRSFQTLILLSPGVVTNNPNGQDLGEYSVNGQRTDANGFQVDGASANNAPGSFTDTSSNTSGTMGMLPSGTALGTTQAMLQLDAMEEFRISTSSYSAEFGNHPGAQVNFRSRSGTNTYHGTLFDYLRNSAFDANNWFNTYSATPTPTPAERQNDFGGTFGGPLSIPHLYSGHDHAFFFFSYEGLRLSWPSANNIYDVPSNGTHIQADYSANPEWANLRKYSPPAVQALLNSFPLPNCDTTISPQCIDYGQGGSPYIASQLTTGTINALSGRIDYQVTPGTRVFARYSDTLSSMVGYGINAAPSLQQNQGRTRIFLLGVDSAISESISNEMRLQYSPGDATLRWNAYQVDGAQPYNLYQAEGINSGFSYVRFYSPNAASQYAMNYGSPQFQRFASDALTWSHNRHLFKFGGSWTQTTSYFNQESLNRSPIVDYHFTAAQALTGVPGTQQVQVMSRMDPAYQQWGLYAQDEWRAFPRLSLSLGIRWDLAPPPAISSPQQLYSYTGNISNPSSMGLSAPGVQLYKTTWHDFAPRVGAALVLHNQAGHETVLRAGGGLYFDSIPINNFFGSPYGLGLASIYSYASQYPLQPNQINVPILAPTTPYSFLDYPVNNIVPPYTTQLNVALEQALGKSRASRWDMLEPSAAS